MYVYMYILSASFSLITNIFFLFTVLRFSLYNRMHVCVPLCVCVCVCVPMCMCVSVSPIFLSFLFLISFLFSAFFKKKINVCLLLIFLFFFLSFFLFFGVVLSSIPFISAGAQITETHFLIESFICIDK